MAYRRRHSTPRSATFEEFRSFPSEEDGTSSPSLAAQAIRASAAHRDSSLSSAHAGDSASSSAHGNPARRNYQKQGSNVYEYSSTKTLNGPRRGFWEVLAKKAKSILEDDKAAQKFEDRGTNHSRMLNSTHGQVQSKRSPDKYSKTENPTFQKDAISSSLKEFGGTKKKAFEGGMSIMENKTANIIHETKKLQIRRKTESYDTENQPMDILALTDLTPNQTTNEIQLKSPQKVANAMAAKANILLRELKTVKADLDFAKQRCAQLEEENKCLRENRQKGDNNSDNPADDDLIRHQLETLLAEKARLAHENSVYARENRFLREIVEYHQLTMQDVVYLDEVIEEDAEVYPIQQNTPLSLPSRSAHGVPSPILSRPATPISNTMPSSSMDAVATPGSPGSPNSPTQTIAETEPAGKEMNPSPSPAAKGCISPTPP